MTAGSRPAAPLGALDVDIEVRVGGFDFIGSARAEPGEILAVLGPNGAGKSTLLNAIAGHLDDVTGTIRLGDAELHSPDGRRVAPEHRRVGLLGQRSLLFPHLTVRENVAFGPRAQGVRRADARTDADRLLDEVGLTGFENRRPAQLSGGQQQRAAIARALAARPATLLLDEPFAALDAQTAAHARRLISELRDRHGIPMVLVTHDVLDAVVLAERTMVLDGGRVAQEGTTREVLSHPGSAFVAALAGVNRLIGTIDASGWLIPEGVPAGSLRFPAPGAAAGSRYSAVFSPGIVGVRTADAATAAATLDSNAAARWAGTVRVLEPIPGGVRIFTAEHPDIAVDCASAVAVEIGVRPGARLRFELPFTGLSMRPIHPGVLAS